MFYDTKLQRALMRLMFGIADRVQRTILKWKRNYIWSNFGPSTAYCKIFGVSNEQQETFSLNLKTSCSEVDRFYQPFAKLEPTHHWKLPVVVYKEYGRAAEFIFTVDFLYSKQPLSDIKEM